jgi:hypothetical protein
LFFFLAIARLDLFIFLVTFRKSAGMFDQLATPNKGETTFLRQAEGGREKGRKNVENF